MNFEALEEAGALGRATYFMRAGYTGSQRWCPQMWAGDPVEGRAGIRTNAPLGEPPAYFRDGSPWEGVFLEAARLARDPVEG